MKNTKVLLLSVIVLSVLMVLATACGSADNGPITLTVKGMVENELELTDAGLRKLEVVTLTLEHPKNGAQEYTGVRLAELLSQADIQADATTLTFIASDGYTFELDLASALACEDCLVAFDPVSEGVYNAAMPGLSSKAWVKTLVSIEVK